MGNLETKICAGEVIVLTAGEYSDYNIISYVVACHAFDIAEAAEEFSPKKKRKPYTQDLYGFAAFLVKTERVVPVAHREIHLGSYGDLSI